MATKRSANEIFQDYYQALMFSLPMTNAKFLGDLYEHISINENFKTNLESLTARKERTSYFLDHIIRLQISAGDNTSFVKLLTVMKTCNYDNVKDLAEEMEAQCTLDIKSTVTEHEPPTTDLDKIRRSVQSLKSRPSLQDLTKLVTPLYAAKWRVIGSLLGLNGSVLEIIEHDHGRSAINCCSEMWGTWLDKDTSATWNDVLTVLEHKTVIQATIIAPTDTEAKDKRILPKLDINHLMNILPSVQEKWQVIGLNLGVPKERLDWISEEADREDIPLRSLDTFCCIKMLTYWFQNSDNVSANAIIEVIKAPHVGLKNKIPSIQEALTSSNVDLVKTTKKYTTSPPESHEMPYIEMKTNVCNEFESSQCSITGVLLYLQNTNIDPDILRNISSFPDLFKSFEAHDLLHAGDPAWLTTIAKYVKCPKALEVIEKYSRLLIADKTICSCDSYKPINGFVAKFLDKTLENCTVKDCSNAKTAVREILDLKDTDGILDHSEVGSLTFYWRVKENVTITIPKFTCASLIKNCKDNGITHIGTITDGNLELVNISELEIDEFTGNQIEKGIKYLEQQYEYIILGRSEHDEWPPDQPNVYTINISIHHKEKFISNDILKVCKITRHNYKEKNTQNAHSYASDDQCRNISDMLVPMETEYGSKSPKTILIEGDPGIGKTMLANQIALQWKNINLLCNKIFLFLIYLRDPKVHEIRTIHDLLKYMFRNDLLEDYNTCIHTYENLINKTNGSCLALLFDGYDELSKEKRKNSFVSKIINHEILKECLLVITSRPFSSEDLHCYACRRIKLLGFTEEDRIVQLKESLRNAQKFHRLMQYLKDHPTINSLCYNSLNMTMFVYLFKQSDHGRLPASQTELFDMFISQTVTHFLKKLYTFNSLSQFKGIHGSILKELGELSFHSLCKDKMVFSSDDLKNDCPKYFSFTSENSCSYGLLKEKRRLCTVDKSYNFLHLTIQEYLAAWHLSNLNNLNLRRLNSIFHTYFWEHRFFNVWVLYVGITKGRRISFRHFISGNTLLQTLLYGGAKRLSPEMLHDKFKSMYLFQCCKESGDVEICRWLGLLLENEVIDLKDHQMSPQNINTLCFVLTFQCTLKELNLSNCDIGDTGCKRFCEDMIEAGLSYRMWIKTLTLSSNQLTTSSVDLLIDLTCAIRIQNLIICDNQLLDRDAELLCRKCKNLEFLCLEDENILRADQMLTNLFYDTDKPYISIAIKESVCLQQTNFIYILSTYVNPRLIKSLYVDCSSSSNNNNLKQVMQKLSLLKFHAIIKLNQSKEVVSLIMKMDTIKELYVSQINDGSYDLMINFIEKSNIVSYALTSFSRFEAKNVHNAKVINSALQKCCTFPSVTNLILHNCRFCTEDLTATIANKAHWSTVILTACGIDVSELSCLYEYFYRIDIFKFN